eukprot:TRINITY_DN7132_c0_g2_i1.p1 TRINITY_DN7132_c0_g2~~TRINITY_DN7132_c0_g2_i1.p1  ORF type:complete len:1109 (-),score=316.76 TRINITY_DN7132_c0_g2_i1:71-3229(-)
MSATEQQPEDVDAGHVPLWVETVTVLSFLTGFLLWRFWSMKNQKKTAKGGGAIRVQTAREASSAQLQKIMEADIETGNHEAVLKAWRAEEKKDLCSGQVLRLAVQSFLEVSSSTVVEEITSHFETHRGVANHRLSSAAAAVLDALARAGQPDLLLELGNNFTERLHIRLTGQMHEAILGGFAFDGREELVKAHIAKIEADGEQPTARARLLILRGMLRKRRPDAAVRQVKEILAAGQTIPHFTYGELARCYCEANRAKELLELDMESPSSDGVAVLMEHCLKINDVALLNESLEWAEQKKVALNLRCYDAALKLLASCGDPGAPELFNKMQASGTQITEGLCVGLLARSAEPKFLRFAEIIFKYAKANLKLSVNLYSALMKVYAFCGNYDDACDLYQQLIDDGLEPDQMMYNCLMKFSALAGRAELSRSLCTKVPCLDIQNYMSMIRAAGQEKNVARAMEVLEMIKATGRLPDTAAYNCALDVCAVTGDLDRLHLVLAEMEKLGAEKDMITYNTILKSFAINKDLDGAKAMLKEMEDKGFKPNDVSYNVIINMAVSNGNLQDAWKTIETMDSKGIKIDQYTLSTMLKTLKKVGSGKDIRHVFALLDKSGVSIATDEVLLNIVLETCIRHRDMPRLRSTLQEFNNSSLKPAVHTYGMLIRAYSVLNKLDKCRELWAEMVEHRGLQPNPIVLGCMLDALVSNGRAEEGVALFDRWRTSVPPNAVMYSTLLKGFVSDPNPAQSSKLLETMRQDGIAMTTALYNLLIDSNARIGNTAEVQRLRNLMVEDKCTPDDYTLSLTTKAYCVSGKLRDAFEEFSQMNIAEMSDGGVVVFNTLLDGCIRNDDFDAFDHLLSSMDKYGIKPTSFTLSTIVKCWGRRRNLDKAFEAVDTFHTKYKVEKNLPVKMCLLSACALCDDLDRALQVFMDIRQSGNGVTSKPYKALIPLSVRVNSLDVAVQLTKEAYGLAPNCNKVGLGDDGDESVILVRLMRALKRVGKLQTTGLPLLEQIKATGARINSVFHEFDPSSAGGGNQQRNSQYGEQDGRFRNRRPATNRR